MDRDPRPKARDETPTRIGLWRSGPVVERGSSLEKNLKLRSPVDEEE